ncbi:RNA polymerase sporulation sigma factor SigK [Desulfosporosinus sp. PR]|uniref:RNA polymerase sporulation sigma factor SigK n=1 Tax=Candidatus Desulfosporosinus nitrosoreducens TaxID=3401928 RepID=UPI0027FAA46B|nr:RNA polymerase sporulation sigma factor SigK [Desulfosporosinus sp. PR]MDQ7094077.1 RNA polymerase sporulation sigma factor SigK [Desulfosporosinus sp. PR]
MFTPTLLISFAFTVCKGIVLLVSYINNNAFPHPLNKEEELHYLQILENSRTNPEPTDENQALVVETARNKLIEHNLRLVAHVVKKYEGPEERTEDLFSIGIVGLVKAINTFNLKNGAKLSTYAARCINNEILMHFRIIKKRRGETSIYSPIGPDANDSELSILESLSADNPPIPEQIADEEDQRLLLEKIKKLPVLDRRVLHLRFGLMESNEHSQQEIADILGISRSYVSRIEKRAIQTLSLEMKDSLP